MTKFAIAITKRERRRPTADGRTVTQVRYFLNYNDPKTGRRMQPSFERRADAEEARNKVVAAVQGGTYNDRRGSPTVRMLVDHWLKFSEDRVKPSTLKGYEIIGDVVGGPLLKGTPRQRYIHSRTGEAPEGAEWAPMLGHILAADLTTSEIRRWHSTLKELIGYYTANRAKSVLKSVLALGEEDFGIRPPSMPTLTGRRSSRPRKTILASDQIAMLLEAAQADPERGVYYAFPFLTGTRASEQLGLLWEDVDFGTGVIRIRHMQERDGSLCDMTKTEAGRREIPMMPILRTMLLEWRERCPRDPTYPDRVFPSPGRPQPWPRPRIQGGRPLSYQNFRTRFWRPIFAELRLPYVSLHSARHSFISTLQAQGVEVGLVAKLAGHANPAVTLGHYTQAVRGGGDAVERLQEAYSGPNSAAA
jgi:integrase